MRLRYRAVDWFHEASREECLRHALPLPVVTCLEERFNALSRFDVTISSCHPTLLVSSSSPQISPEHPREFHCVEETNIYDKFLREIFPGCVQPLHRQRIDLRTGVLTVSESMYNWFCSDVQDKVQIQEEDTHVTCSTSQRINIGEIPEEDMDMTCSTFMRIDTIEIHGEDANMACTKSQGTDTSTMKEEDLNMTDSRSQRINISGIHEVTAKYIVVDNVPKESSSNRQSTSGPRVKERKQSRSTISKFLEIEPPLLELRDCIRRPENISLLSLSQYRSRIILELGGPSLSAAETKEEAAFKFTVAKAWFDISALPCSPKRCYNSSTAEEARLNDIQELRRIDETCHSQQYPDKMTNPLVVKIKPIETLMIQEKLYWQTARKTHPIEPNCLLDFFESHGDKIIEKEAESLSMGDFNTKISAVENLSSNLVYHFEHPHPPMLPPGLLCDQSDSQPCSTAVMDFATGSFRGTKLTFEIPTTCDLSLSSLANTNPSIIAADETETLVPDLPRLHPSRNFESSIVVPELSLDDDQFQFLPVPVVTGPQDEVIDAELGRLMSCNCEPSAVPATDWLYLDWHFFHGLKCTNAACFSLQVQLTEALQCRPFPSIALTADVVTSRKRSELALELILLEDHNWDRDLSLISRASGKMCENIVSLLRSPLQEISQTRGEESFRAPKETQKPQERAQKSLPQIPCANFPTGVDMIAANGFLSARHASNLLRNQCSLVAEGRNVQVQEGNINPVSKQRPHLQNPKPAERLGIGEPDSLRTLNAGKDLHRTSHQEIISNDPLKGQDSRPTISIQTGSDFMESDFDFFVQARNGIPMSGYDPLIRKDSEENNSIAVNDLQHISISQPALLATRESDDQRHTTPAAASCAHEIGISLEIHTLMVSLSSNYSALLALDEIVQLKTNRQLDVLKQFGFDADGNSHLTSLISDISSEPDSQHRQVLLRGLIALQVLRYTALNLWDYGIQVAHLYLQNCFERMRFLEGYIMSPRTELEEAYNQVERGVVEDHPKLCYLDKLLRPDAMEVHHVKHSSRRILLLADRRAFFTVVRKLVSLGLTPHQIDRRETYLHDGVLKDDSVDKLKDEILEALTVSDCLLVSYAYVNPSFPVERFTIIIQYADPPTMDATDSNWSRGKCEMHFFKLKAYNLNGNVPLRQPNPAALAHSTDQSLDQSSSLNKEVISNDNEPQRSKSSGGAKEQLVDETCLLDKRCEMVIVANISPPNDHMLTGRRSSYQNILHLEKENFQVVERELRLPVDLILSPASCLVIYTLGKLKLEPHSLKDKQTALQNDVVTHLKAISFSFRDCIMIFEGPTEFTRAALDIFTHIYALAIALEMHFQCFASRHQDVTDRILMHSVQAVRRARHMPSCPVMTEGPTLAEVFLTEFPSINPLSAHAILSSGCPLPVFMSHPPERQFAAVEEYGVPKHCLDLFKAQCTYKVMAANTITMSDNCKVVEQQTNQATDEETPYLHQADPQAVSLPHHRPASEVWASFPEFPPAFAISDNNSPAYNVSNNTHKIIDYSPAYNVSNTHESCDYSRAYHVSNAHQMSTFLDFPPISEVRGCEVEDPEEREPSSTGLYGALDILKHSPAQVAGMKSAGWSLAADTDDIFSYEGVAPHKYDPRSGFQHPQNDIQWLSNGFGSAEFGESRHGAESGLRLPQNSDSAAHCEVADHAFELEMRNWSRETSAAPVNGSKRLSGRSHENPHGGYEVGQNSAEVSGRGIRAQRNGSGAPLGAKRRVSSFSVSSPTVYGVNRQETGWDTALGSWNDHKGVRGVAGGFQNETFDLHEEGNDDRFDSKPPTDTSSVDGFSAVLSDWIDRTASVQEESSFTARSLKQQQSRRPQPATLRASSLDRFRHSQTRSPVTPPGTAFKNYTQAKIKFPRKPPPPPRKSRTQSPNITYLRPTTIAKPASVKNTLGDNIGADQRSKTILGYARRGSDSQQCLVWKKNPTSSSSKRQRIG